VLYILASRQTKLITLDGNPRISVGITNKPLTDWTDWFEMSASRLPARPELLHYADNPELTWQRSHTTTGKNTAPRWAFAGRTP